MSTENTLVSTNFIEDMITEDLKNGRFDHVQTRFPPEPNGYLHIGHAKAICIDFLTAKRFGGQCNLRFDDTNPAKEDDEYVKAIQADLRWLGFAWDKLCYGSDYSQTYYDIAVKLIKNGKAYVCDLSQEDIRAYRGTLKEPGKESPYRNRSIEENLALFEEMKAGKFPEGSRVLRAKIDMSAPNMNLRDPVLYRIVYATHHRTGKTWCIYPMYDYAHPIQDSVEGVSHSLCSLEFEDHRPLYNWVIENSGLPHHSRQIEFARLNITRTLLSKRYLRALVENKRVSGWDDPRMPTLVGLRRRGVPPSALIKFVETAGVSKANSEVDIALFDHCVREELSDTAKRVMAVLRPLKVIIDNYPAGQTEKLMVENHPEHPKMGSREVSFSKEIYIEQDDFMIEPVKKFFRLFIGGEVRLKGAYIIQCQSVVQNEKGEVTEVHCTYDPDTKSGLPGSAKKVKGTLHWVDGATALPATVRLYDLLTREVPEEEEVDTKDPLALFNTESLEVLQGCLLENSLKDAFIGEQFQFMRQGYFAVDPDTKKGNIVINRIVNLKDSWVKIQTP